MNIIFGKEHSRITMITYNRFLQMKCFVLLKSVSLILLTVFLCNVTYGQGSGKKKSAPDSEAVRQLIESRHFTCAMQSVTPSGGRMKQLSPGYTLTVAGDSLISNLPYFGTAQISSNTSGAGYMFTSASIDYEISIRKKGGWEIRIKPKDQQENPSFMLTVFESGNASLYVNSISRSSISYAGSLVVK